MGTAASPAFSRLCPDIIVNLLRKFSWKEGVPTRVAVIM